MKRTIAILIFSLLSTGNMVWSSSAFAQKTFGLYIADQVTPEHVKMLKSYGIDADQISDVRRLVTDSTGKIEINFDKAMNVPYFLKAEFPFPTGITKPEEQGYHFFEKFRKLYRIKNPRNELKPVKIRGNRLKRKKVRYQQNYKGIKVLGADMIVHFKPDNRLWFIQGKYVSDITVSTSPAVEAVAVPQIVENNFNERRGLYQGFSISAPEPGILNPWVSDRTLENRNLLVWVSVVKEEKTGRSWTYYINALNGQVLDVMDSARYINSEIKDRQNTLPTSDDETWYQDDVQTRAGTPDPDTADLNTFTTEYWDYLLNAFGVYSINSANSPEGRKLTGNSYSVDMACGNACWNCIYNQAIFCENWVTRDIVAHEYTHGLVQHSGGNLRYRNQSGALNESFADVFAEFLDCRSGACDWLVGWLRDLSTPLNSGQDPDHVGSTGNAATDHPFFIAPCDPSLPDTDPSSCVNTDMGGVHTNSGVPNVVAYLIVNGTTPNDPHYNYQIRGLGLVKTEQLYYSTLVDTGLSTSADFIEARNVMVSVCDDFATSGTHGFTDNDCCQVKNVWRSVGVGAACSVLSTSPGGSLSTDSSPYFVAVDTVIPPGQTLTVPANVDVYFFPNAKIKAMGILDADGTSGDIRFLSSRDNSGMRIRRDYHLTNGGELKMPVNTYHSTDTEPHAITIRDGREVSSFIRIDKGFTVTDVNVTLNINHIFDRDLTVSLESPSGTSVLLFSNVGGSSDNFVNTILDDEATTAITAGAAPFTGFFQPTGSLSDFDVENSVGYWRLRIDDAAGGGQGTLESWSVTFNQ